MPPGDDATQVISRPQATAVLPPQESAPGTGRNVWLGVLIGVIVVAVLGGAGYLLAQGLLSNNDDTTAPFPVANVIGFTQEHADAGARRRRLGGRARVQGERHGQARPRHRPIPVAGTTVDPGSTVIITIAKAPPPVVVPTFTGLTLGDAQTLATENKLVLVPTEGVSDTVDAARSSARIRSRARRSRRGRRSRSSCRPRPLRWRSPMSPASRSARPSPRCRRRAWSVSPAGPHRCSPSVRTRTGSPSRTRPPGRSSRSEAP